MKKNAFLLLLGLILMLPISVIYARATCQPDKAYIVGVRDGSKNWRFQKSYGLRECHKNKEEVNQAYLKGYAAGKAGTQLAQEQCLKINFGKVCGYDCKQGKGNQVKCATYPTQNCLVDRDGQVHCGYGCTEMKGYVKCGTSFSDKCIAARDGIHCGKNCRQTQEGGIHCDDARAPV